MEAVVSGAFAVLATALLLSCWPGRPGELPFAFSIDSLAAGPFVSSTVL